MAKTILPSSVNKAENLKAIDKMVAERFGDIDTSVVMMSIIDLAPAAALPILAEEYQVLGYNGWKYADTEQKQRDILKEAYLLHRQRGTPWAIKNALRFVGIVGGVTLQENMTICYDGSWVFNGYVFYGRHWAYFRVIIDIANAGNVPLDDIKGIINAYKRETQWLFDVLFAVDDDESITAEENITATAQLFNQGKISISENINVTILP